jgi:regulatory protein
LQAALRYLSYRSRSEAELRQHLTRRGYAPGAVDSTTAKLRSLNYLNDETFAREWALARAQSRRFGPKKIEQELRSKGLAPALVREALRQTFDQIDEHEQARRLLSKRFKVIDIKDAKTVRRAAAFLERRGYSSKVVSNLLRYFAEDEF